MVLGTNISVLILEISGKKVTRIYNGKQCVDRMGEYTT